MISNITALYAKSNVSYPLCALKLQLLTLGQTSLVMARNYVVRHSNCQMNAMVNLNINKYQYL